MTAPASPPRAPTLQKLAAAEWNFMFTRSGDEGRRREPVSARRFQFVWWGWTWGLPLEIRRWTDEATPRGRG